MSFVFRVELYLSHETIYIVRLCENRALSLAIVGTQQYAVVQHLCTIFFVVTSSGAQYVGKLNGCA